MDADQDMNWKIEWDNGLNVDQQDTGLDTDFGIGLGVGQNTTIDWDFGLSWSTDSELHKPLVEWGYSYHHACNSNRKPYVHIYDRCLLSKETVNTEK